jgi:hypothetical protein
MASLTLAPLLPWQAAQTASTLDLPSSRSAALTLAAHPRIASDTVILTIAHSSDAPAPRPGSGKIMRRAGDCRKACRENRLVGAHL